ncbi:hypothetical protein NHX12_009001 [Muraenolepis orangiensis]|uniref:Peptidase S54 rhomboid domain-containing protein n=1 Tax=Muraenolepis orangiensis TaxID=630683 RepID=A0A9Q0I9W9_9TELE|nr:hypothetical protein NHX12_009001 [Muraenolepis orangiensis]
MAWRGCVFRSLAREQLLSSASRANRLKHGFQQRSAFRRPAKKTDAKRGVEEDAAHSHAEASESWTSKRVADPPLPAPHTPPRDFGRLVKPLIFTVGFTGCSFATAAIWQYESLKSRVQSYFDELRADWMEKLRPQKQGDYRKEINQWWNNLSEGQRTVTGIIVANVAVYCCWRVPALQRTMLRYFTSDPSASSVISTMASYIVKTASGRFGPSLGASGAIMTVLAAVCTKMPEAKLAIIFLPMFTFTAGNALKAIVAMDAAGVVLGWRFFDHAAHLGGALFGVWYIMFGHELIWKNRDALVKAVGVMLGLVGWCVQSSCTSSHRWRVRQQVDSLMFEGLWMSCVSTNLGSVQCNRFQSLLALPVHIQVCRGLMVGSLLVGLVSLVLSVLGLRCTQLRRVSPQTKTTLAVTGGSLFILSGLLGLVAVSWYASRVVQEFNNPYSGRVRFELGAGLYQGWAASCLCLLGGALLCCSYRKEEELHNTHRFSYKYRTASPGLPIYTLPPPGAGKAYV